jgi:hypothetical protein
MNLRPIGRVPGQRFTMERTSMNPDIITPRRGYNRAHRAIVRQMW